MSHHEREDWTEEQLFDGCNPGHEDKPVAGGYRGGGKCTCWDAAGEDIVEGDCPEHGKNRPNQGTCEPVSAREQLREACDWWEKAHNLERGTKLHFAARRVLAEPDLEVERLRGLSEGRGHDLRQCRKRISELESEVERLRGEDVTKLEAALKKARLERETDKAALREYCDQRDRDAKIIEESVRDLDNANERAEELEREVERLRDELGDERDITNDEVRQLEAEVERLRVKIQAANSQADILRESHDHDQRRISELKCQLESRAAPNDVVDAYLEQKWSDADGYGRGCAHTGFLDGFEAGRRGAAPAPTGELAEALSELRGVCVAFEDACGTTDPLPSIDLLRSARRVLAAPVPRSMTAAERDLCDFAVKSEPWDPQDVTERGAYRLRILLESVRAERHPAPKRTLEDVERDITDFKYHNPTASVHDMQSLFDERRRLLDETKPG